jgi:hypothetical protein
MHIVATPSLVSDQNVPAGHSLHLLADVSPISVEKEFGGHARHDVDASAIEYEPSLHKIQDFDEEAPNAVE